MIKHKLLFVLLSSLLLSACARKAQYNEEVRYTISYTNGKVSGDVYHSCYNLDNDSNPCSTDRSYRTACYRKLSGSGFVPCSACDEKYSEEELINVINNNRSKTLPSFVRRTRYHPVLDMKTKTVKVEYHMKTKTGLIIVRLNKFFPTAFTNLKKYWR